MTVGSSQSLVGSASARVFEQMNVRSFTGATAEAAERARWLLRCLSGSRRMSIPEATTA